MKTVNLLFALAVFILAACSSSKKTVVANTSANTSTTASTASAAVTPSPVPFPKSTNGLFSPGPEELGTIQLQFKDATMDQLKEGYTLYNQTACLSCHGAKNIYTRDVMRWKMIIDDMSARSQLNASQKDAVYKYVLAIKATQPK